MKQTIISFGEHITAGLIKPPTSPLAVVFAIGLMSCIGILPMTTNAEAKVKNKDALQSADRIVAIVDDEPISEYEVVQRMKLVRALGNPKIKDAKLREDILKRLVDERLQDQEAKRLKIKVTKEQIQNTINVMAKRVKQTLPQIKARLAKKGVRMATFETQVKATISWNAVIRRRFASKVSVDQETVKLTFEDLKKNPKPGRKLLVLRQVTLPLERGFPGMANSRLREAGQIYRGFKGCRSLKRLTSQIFNVRVSPSRTIPLKALPPKARKLLSKMGPGRITRPSVNRGGIVLLAYCANKIIKAPEITLKQIKSQLMSQQYGLMALRHLRDLRRDATIEYR